MARYLGVASSPQANDPEGPAPSLDHYVIVDGEDNWNLADLNVAEELLEHTSLKANFAELEEACRCTEVAVSSSVIDVADFFIERFYAHVAAGVFSNDPLPRDAEMSQVRMRYDRVVAQLGGVHSVCDSSSLQAQERDDDIIDTADFQKEKEAVDFEKTNVLRELIAFRRC